MRLPTKRQPTHAGEILLKDFLAPMGITQSKFAKHLGWTYARVNEIVNGKRGITADTALAFAEAFNMEAEFWLNLQLAYDLWHAKQKHTPIDPIAA
ncbi:HigA family addiction module antitoxin [Facilibium subflavum]|uniref:HigA family addiction module antitoxin n=1 Tax=Facilibium subflavum TaxID=2219058 RepID=UPI000E65D1D1|nr:HigA family addiction module antitoxin [Facilibium subflavum]